MKSPAARLAWGARMAAASAGHTPSEACGPVQPGFERCFALQIATSGAPANTCGADSSYIPCDLQTAYNLPSATNGRGRTVAIVDAFGDPSAEADLAVYRSNFGLPACTTANGCFRKVNQTGGTSYPGPPPANDNWPLETSLDLDMVSAICPNCHILLVEAHSDQDNSLFISEDEAATLGATEISNSWGGMDGMGEASLDTYFDHPGVAITASTGDNGWAAGVEYPAASPDVTAVGGTTLVPAANPRGFSETAWSGAGSGCSLGETPQPSWQHGVGVDSSCNARADADVSAIADPNHGVYTYDTDNGVNGWIDVGGTSVASPIIASVYALTASATTYSPSYVYSHTSGLNDVTSGSNGSCGNDLCNAGVGWDGPTGLGTPNGISAFGIGPQAVIGSLFPGTGPVAGGQTVTVNGSGFAAGMTATLGGTSVTPADVTFNSFTFTTPPETAGYVQLQVTTSVGSSALTAAAGYIYVGLGNYVPLAPFRILDTRDGAGDPLGSGATRTLQIAGVGTPPIPAGASAVVLNVTEVNGTAGSLLTVYPTGTLRPNASNLNFAAGTTDANLVTATLGQGGSVSIYNAVGSVNVVADVEGYFEPPASSTPLGEFHAIAPVRVCDTRSARSPTPCSIHGPLVGGTPMVVNVTGSAPGTSIPSNGDAEAGVLNVTGVAGSLGTYIAVFPTTSSGSCPYNGANPPRISTLNLKAGANVANRVMVALGPASTGGPDTSICVYAALGRINVVLDAGGWYGSAGAPAGAQYEAISPSRVCDTRVASAGCSTGAIGLATSRIIGVAGNGGVPGLGGSNPVIVGVIANLTAILPTASTYLTLYPSDPGSVQTPPNASDLNANAGETLPNLAVVQLDTSADPHQGDVSLYNAVGSVNAVIDLEGWFQ